MENKITNFIQIGSRVIRRNEITGFSIKVSLRPYDEKNGSQLHHISDEKADIENIYLTLGMKDEASLTVKYNSDRSLNYFMRFLKDFFYPGTPEFSSNSEEYNDLSSIADELFYHAPIENDNSEAGN